NGAAQCRDYALVSSGKLGNPCSVEAGMNDVPLPWPEWRKSSRSGGGECVEVALLSDGVAVRDSRRPGGPILIFDRGQWDDFLAGLRDGEFDREFDGDFDSDFEREFDSEFDRDFDREPGS